MGLLTFLIKFVVNVIALILLIPFSILRLFLSALDNVYDWADNLIEYEEEPEQ